MPQDIMFLYIKSDNLIKAENLVRKSFGVDEIINDATIKMTLYKGDSLKIATGIPGKAIKLLESPVNKGGGLVGLIIGENPFSVGEVLSISGTSNYDGEITVDSINASDAIAEVQTLHLSAVATAGSFRLGYKGEWTPAVNEVQTVTITGSPTGGTFTLSFGGYATSAIAYNASAATVKSALEALTSIGSGNVLCTGGSLPGTAIVVEFIGKLAGQPIAAMTGSGAGLTGGTTPAVSIAETVSGQGLPYNASVADVQAALEALSTVEAGDIAVSGRTLNIGDMVFTFDIDIQDAPMIEISSNLTGPATCVMQQTVQGLPASATYEVVYAGKYFDEAFTADSVIQKITNGAIDRGSGNVGIPVLDHNLEIGDTVRIWGTRHYDGIFQITGVDEDEIQIAATYVAEDFTGSEYLYVAVPNGIEIAFTPEGEGGNYSGILPDTVDMVPNATYYLEISAKKGDSDLLERHTCMAVFFPKQELY